MTGRITVVVFAQTPPPEHGQSRMVLLALEALRDRPSEFDVHHVNSRFSNTLEDIGDSTISKTILLWKYVTQAIRLRANLFEPILYYVPGPVKWSSVIRDWVILSSLRVIYPRVIFHWHAIGHGEWANGSKRLALEGPRWIDSIARKISAVTLNQPFASISVSDSSQADSIALGSLTELVVSNGIEDPCAGFVETLARYKVQRLQELSGADLSCFRILFLSHGTLEKGITDALECFSELLQVCDRRWRFEVTFAGGVSDSIRGQFDAMSKALLSTWSERIVIIEKGYLTGQDKHACFVHNDIFLAPSRWESFGLTVIEAMAYSMPIVAAASDGVRGVLPEDYLYLSPVKSPKELAEKLRICCLDLITKTSSDVGARLRMRFLAKYQIKDFSHKLSESIHSLVASTKQKSFVFNDALRGQAVSCANQSHLSGICSQKSRSFNKSDISVSLYLADQNPGFDRSFGISRMTQIVMTALHEFFDVNLVATTSKTSQKPPLDGTELVELPWGTRSKFMRFLTDHFHPLFSCRDQTADVHFYPKGYLPLLSALCRPSVVTIHDTIIQYDQDHYPKWRSRWEYGYWSLVLRHTLRKADRILTVSQSSREQIRAFMARHKIPEREITVTYEPCAYENVEQPQNPEKSDNVIHLASVEPHKRTAHLIRWWYEAETQGIDLPSLHLIGSVPPEVLPILSKSEKIVKRPFLEDHALQSAYKSAKALILPSEIEGFGLPALEAYYLGTPVCFVKGTSVEEVLGVTTGKGAFSLDSRESMIKALHEVMAMPSEEVRSHGLKLRETYAAEKVAARLMRIFQELGGN